MTIPHAYLVESIPLDMEDVPSPEGVAETKIALRQLVDGAEQSIELTAVYWSLLANDDDTAGLSADRLAELGAGYGRTLFVALASAAQRGVQIRILQSPGFDEGPQESARLAAAYPDQVHIRQANMAEWYSGGFMHHKLWVVDGRSFYLGSANLDWRSLTQVKELGVIVENQPVIAADAARQFEAWWQFAALEPQSVAVLDTAVQLSRIVPMWSDLVAGNDRIASPLDIATPYNFGNPMTLTANEEPASAILTASPPELSNNGRTDDLAGLLHTIRSAETSICLSVMIFIPTGWLNEQMFYWPSLTDGLLQAAIARGVRVRLLISHWPHTAPMTWPFLQALRDMAAAAQMQEEGRNGRIEVKRMLLPGWDETEGDARRYPDHSRVNHPKFIVTDHLLNIGTSNMTWNYFHQTIGGSFNTDHPVLIGQAQSIFDRDWTSLYARPLESE